MSDEFEYSIQETSARLGVPIQKLRRWDQQGVLVARRTQGGHRRYPKELIDRLAATALGSQPDRQAGELATVKKALREKRRIIQLLLESENRYRDLVETSHDLIWSTDAHGRFTYLNSAAREIFGLTPKELLGRCFFDFEARPSHVSNRRFLALLRRQGEVRNYMTHLVTVGGEDRWVGINARVHADDQKQIIGIRGTARDVTDQLHAARRIEHLAKSDLLTDLPNRLSLQEAISSSMESSAVGAVMFIDLDHFKYVNDNFGHRAGDQLIIGVGGVLRDVVREQPAQVYRLGGDEFAIHLPGLLRSDAVAIAERALDAIRHYKFSVNGDRHVSNLTASAGIALYPFHGSDLTGLLSNVDIAMYQAKDHGRNRYVLFDQDAHNIRSTHRRVHWAKRLREVLDDGRVELYSQPVVRLSDGVSVHHEILARLRDHDGTIVAPGDFIEIAESLGAVRDIDMCVVEKLLAHLRRQNAMGQKLRYFVNLSRVSISDHHWVRRFTSMLSGSDVDPRQLVFEITETAAMSEIDVTLSFIRGLKKMGCRFALDDFGAGFSSFYYLKRFDVDYLKIDGGFVRDLARDEGNRLFVRALTDVARGLNKQVIAEWVENRDVLEHLTGMGVQFGQGFLFHRPSPLEASPAPDDARALAS